MHDMIDRHCRLSHYSNEPVVTVRSVEQGWRYGMPSVYEKPSGLWVSVDGEDDWTAWCKSERFAIGTIHHRVWLAPGANLLWCDCANDLDCLTERYGAERSGFSWRQIAIDWARVAGDYQGIIIAPYIWSRRLHDAYSWYYSWDCASGCIWDADAIELIQPIMEAA